MDPTCTPGAQAALPYRSQNPTSAALQGLSEAAFRAIQAPAASPDMGRVQYPAFGEASDAAVDAYAAYPQVSSPVSKSPRVAQRTEIFMDYYSDLSRYARDGHEETTSVTSGRRNGTLGYTA